MRKEICTAWHVSTVVMTRAHFYRESISLLWFIPDKWLGYLKLKCSKSLVKWSNMGSLVIEPCTCQHGCLGNTRTMKWRGFWWANISLFKLNMALYNDEFHHPQSGEPTGLRAWHPMKSVVYIGPKHICIDIGFPRVWSASAFLLSPKTPWWRHQMETFSALLALCAGNSPVPGEFPTQRPVTRGFDVYFDLRPNKRLSKQSLGWWFETLSPPLLRHRNAELDHG